MKSREKHNSSLIDEPDKNEVDEVEEEEEKHIISQSRKNTEKEEKTGFQSIWKTTNSRTWTGREPQESLSRKLALGELHLYKWLESYAVISCRVGVKPKKRVSSKFDENIMGEYSWQV